jgi:hypothetical protein
MQPSEISLIQPSIGATLDNGPPLFNEAVRRPSVNPVRAPSFLHLGIVRAHGRGGQAANTRKPFTKPLCSYCPHR